jgi:hypothetical protein
MTEQLSLSAVVPLAITRSPPTAVFRFGIGQSIAGRVKCLQLEGGQRHYVNGASTPASSDEPILASAHRTRLNLERFREERSRALPAEMTNGRDAKRRENRQDVSS